MAFNTKYIYIVFKYLQFYSCDEDFNKKKKKN